MPVIQYMVFSVNYDNQVNHLKSSDLEVLPKMKKNVTGREILVWSIIYSINTVLSP